MTAEQLSSILKESGLPVTLSAWPESKAPALPYICYLQPFTNNFFADGVVYYSVTHVQVELYTKLREPTTEFNLEAVFSSHDMPWEKTVTYIDAGECYQILYDIEV